MNDDFKLILESMTSDETLEVAGQLVALAITGQRITLIYKGLDDEINELDRSLASWHITLFELQDAFIGKGMPIRLPSTAPRGNTKDGGLAP